MPLFRNSPTGRTRRRIIVHDGSNDADSCHIAKIEKSPNISNGVTDRHKILHDDAH